MYLPFVMVKTVTKERLFSSPEMPPMFVHFASTKFI